LITLNKKASTRLNNDATLSKLGDIYQNLLVLEECLKMDEGDKIYVETYGDITKIPKNDSFQMEVKHHIGSKKLLDRDKDFWNTLKNWVENYSKLKDIKKFILHTTALPIKDTAFHMWADLTVDERYNKLYSIGMEKKKREKQFRHLYNKIFAAEKEIIVHILSRLEIHHSQQSISKLKKSLKTYFKVIPNKNYDNLIEALLGHIFSVPIEEPHTWVITYEDFDRCLKNLGARYANETKQPMIATFQTAKAPNPETYHNNTFVEEIRRIDYLDAIPDAINNYWRTNTTVAMYYLNDPVYLKDIDIYKINLTDKLQSTKKPKERACKTQTKEKQIEMAQDLYDDVMAWDAISFGSIDPNQPFFQKGIIHNIVDEGNFKWKLGEKE